LQRGNISRKRNREGQLTSEIQVESVGTSEQVPHNGSIEIIDVEQVKGTVHYSCPANVTITIIVTVIQQILSNLELMN
jgi:hypothetical protein